ncbi:MAG TPA: polysaccharide deacetylase family protein [Vicinamibacterales bacterium]|nr:polysaccharide deacetylase family protein [Vicinamibacterales bacterium]
MLTPGFFTPLTEQPGKKPELFVIVDTEEEFDWAAPFARENVSVTAIPETARLQKVAAGYGLKPTYVVDYPVASTPSSAGTLAGFAADGQCYIGAHLHPWVTPPFEEPLTREMSFACNLGADLERAKIEALTEAIQTRMHVRPRVYKAGRYGFGPGTARILESLGYDVDTSVIPHMDFSPEKGPDFSGFSVRPGSFGSRRRLLELPCTLDYIGAARRFGEPLHRAASARFLEPVRAVGILARTGMLNKVMLSPEGNTLDEMTALTRALVADGVRTFALTFHSPSLKPGCTRYVRDAAERDAFVATIDRYFDYFFAGIGGQPTAASEIFDALAN